jgi:hypothetical protein
MHPYLVEIGLHGEVLAPVMVIIRVAIQRMHRHVEIIHARQEIYALQ